MNALRSFGFFAVAALVGLSVIRSPMAQGVEPSWIDASHLAEAKKEGSLVVYSSTNQEEGLPLWQLFEDATGIKVNYVRASDVQVLTKVLIESRARQQSWDVVQTANVNRFPPELLLSFEPAEARNLMPEAISQDKRWYGVYANYNTPAYNTTLVKPADLPLTYEDFASTKNGPARSSSMGRTPNG